MAKATKLIVLAPLQIIFRGKRCSPDCMLYDYGDCRGFGRIVCGYPKTRLKMDRDDWPIRCEACIAAEKAAAK